MSDPFADMLGGGGQGEGPMGRVSIPAPRFFRVRVSEVPNGQGLRPGHTVNLAISGTVKMIDDEGEIMVAVTRVEGKGNSFGNGDAIIVKPEIEASPS